MGEVRLFEASQWDEFIQSLNNAFHSELGHVLLLEQALDTKQATTIEGLQNVICLGIRSSHWPLDGVWPHYIHGVINNPQDPEEIERALEHAKQLITLRHENLQLKYKAEQEAEKRTVITESALELTQERDLQKLCDTILSKMRSLLHSEGASLYLADTKNQQLQFSHVQNEKISPVFGSFHLPIDTSSLVGTSAYKKELIHIPDVENIQKQDGYQINRSFDNKTGYKTKSVLCIPLLKTNEELVGVVQMINSKRSGSFSQEDLQFAKALSSHIAIAIETALLYENVENLFDSFVKASVTAIESRDPTTSGHSERVAELTITLAHSVSDSIQPAFSPIVFKEQQIKELRYASLLHDFGKIGVPESVLVKEKKLQPHELESIQNRLLVLQMAYPDQEDHFKRAWKAILQANEPTVLVEELKDDIKTFLGQRFTVDQNEFPILTEEEFNKLSIKKGSLSEDERKQIESHVTQSYRFLEQIPWTKQLENVPSIALSHHERLNGTGYPSGLTKENIPFESQIMAVADVFDALTAMDRPYKKAVPLKRALEILDMESEEFKLNPELVQLFKEQRAYECLSIFNSKD